jgi:serine/threonine protein kinase
MLFLWAVVLVEASSYASINGRVESAPANQNQKCVSVSDAYAPIQQDIPATRKLSDMVYLKLPMNWGNISSLTVLLVLAIIGCIAVWHIATRRQCSCNLCNGTYQTIGTVGKGSFGSVFEVRMPIARRAAVPLPMTPKRPKKKQAAQGSILGSVGISSAVAGGSDDSSSNFKHYVLKMIQLDDISDANEAQAEAKDLRALRHPLIVQYKDDFIHKQWGKMGELVSVCIVMEKCNKDLRDVILEYQEMNESEYDMDVEGFYEKARIEQQRAVADAIEGYCSDAGKGDGGPSGCGGDGHGHRPVHMRLKYHVPEQTVMQYLMQTCQALDFCHNRHIMHRDIKVPVT